MVYKKRPTIGVLLSNMGWWYTNTIAKELIKEAKVQSVNLRFFIGSFIDSPLPEEKIQNITYSLATPNCVDGLIVLSGPLFLKVGRDRKKPGKLLKPFAPLPIISIGMESREHCAIMVDNKKAMEKMTDHMIEVHGYRKLAYVSGPGTNYESRERLKGFKQSLESHGIPFDEENIFYGTFGSSDGKTLASQIFAPGKSRPEAILCANDRMLSALYYYVNALGIKVPGDIAMTGYDNMPQSQFCLPTLTSVDQCLAKQGAEAVRQIKNILRGGKKAKKDKNVIIQAELVIRESCGCRDLSHERKAVKYGLLEQDILEIKKMDSLEWVFKKAGIGKKGLKGKKEAVCGLYAVIREELERDEAENGMECPGSSKPDRIIENLKDYIYHKSIDGEELQSWYRIMDYLFRFVAGTAAQNKLPRLENIEKRTVHFLDKIKHLLEGNDQLETNNVSWDVRELLEGLSGCYNLEELLDVIEDKFCTPRLKRFYLLLYEGDKIGYSPEEIKGRPVRMHLGYNGHKIVRFKKSVPFPPDKLLPEECIKSNKTSNLLTYSICTPGKYYGFVVFKYNSDLLHYYELIRTRLCQLFDMVYNFSGIEQTVKERTSELEKANARLHELDRAKTNFFANISHELRTPLTLILGPVEGILAGDYGKKIDNDNTIFKSVINNSSRLLKLINSLLDFSRIEAGKMQLIKKKTHIDKLLNYYFSIIRSSGKHRGIEVALKIKTGDVTAWIDRDLLEKALFNLFSNSLKFTPRGGKITICLDSDKDCFSISVKDTGIGIPGDKLETIFDRFTQVDEGASRKYEGTGIGLAFTKEIATLHKGSIAVKSTYGKGAVFTITLPYGREKGEEKETGAEKKEPEDTFEIKEYLLADIEPENISGPLDKEETQSAETDILSDNRKKILIVDDNSQVRAFLSSIIGRSYQVITAENGITGLEKASFFIPDLIISDVMMSGMDGIEFCHKLKAAENLKHIPLILLTARTDFSLKIAGLEGKADDFLCKPFNSKELLTRVKNLLHSRELQAELSKKQNTIMSSVKYAARIQASTLPKEQEMKLVLQDYFIFWQPRGNVGGDIYWFKRLGENFILAVIDCTGHSVPGAFLAMTVQAELTGIVKYVCNENPGRILTELNNSIKKTLNQEREQEAGEFDAVSDDGLDMALCYCNRKEKKILFAGARQPLFYVENNKLIEVKPDNMSIGYRNSILNYDFTNHEVDLTGEQVFYLSSDGYADQLGGTKGTCFGREHLKELLLRIHGETMSKQKYILEEELKEYQNRWKQIDDITILGFIPLIHLN